MSDSTLAAMLDRLWWSTDNRTAFGAEWTQGRSAFGGLSAAMAVTGMRKTLDEPMPLRSLMVSFVGPIAPGEVQVDAEVLRQGKNVTQVQANLIAEGQIGLQAMGVFGRPRAALALPDEAPIDPVPREVGLQFATHRSRMPEFLKRYDGYWVSEGGLPFSGRPSRNLNFWVRHEEDMGAYPCERLVALADMPPPVVLSYFDKPPVPASSLTWSLEFVRPPESVESEWLYMEFTAEAAAEGYTQQSGRIYEENGRLCTLSRQCMVYFG